MGHFLLGLYVDGSISSQFISSLLIAAPYADNDVHIHLTGDPVSLPYILMTIDSMRAFGAEVFVEGDEKEPVFTVSSQKRYKPQTYGIEGDFSSSSYWFALAAICGGSATISGLNPLSAQGDRRLLEILVNMGCQSPKNRSRSSFPVIPVSSSKESRLIWPIVGYLHGRSHEFAAVSSSPQDNRSSPPQDQGE